MCPDNTMIKTTGYIVHNFPKLQERIDEINT